MTVDTPLTKAIIEGRMNHAYNLVRYTRVPLHETNGQGYTPLMLACKYHCHEFAHYLLDQGLDLHLTAVNHNGNTALMIACSKGLPEIALRIIATNRYNGAQVNRTQKTALIYAIQKNLYYVAGKLIDNDVEHSISANVAHANRDGNNALMLACKQGWEDIAYSLAPFSPINQVNVDGNNAVMLAYENWLVVVAVELLLKPMNGENVNLKQVNVLGKTVYDYSTKFA